MENHNPPTGVSFRRSFWDVFEFFLALGKNSKRTKVFAVLSFLPIAIALIVKFVQIFSDHIRLEGAFIFSDIIMSFYLKFLILILSLFYGISIVSEELEGKTLSYLTTRPIQKPAIILGKYTAYTLIMIIMTTAGVLFSFFILNLNHLTDWQLYKILFRDIGVLSLGLICYTAFFTFIGTFLKKSIMFGLVFSFGWENVIQYFPGSTQKFAIAHYLKSLLPPSSGQRFSFLLFRLEATPAVTSIMMLLLITIGFLGLACFLFSQKEYILED